MTGGLLERDRLVFANDEDGASPRDALLELLSRESHIYGELVELSQKEQEALLERSIIDLVHIVRRKEELAQEVGDPERHRLEVIARWCRELDLHLPEPTLGELLPYLEEGDARELDGLRETILGRIEELAAIHQRNALLLASALALVDASLNFLLGGAEVKQATYAEDGQLKSATEDKGLLALTI